MIPRANDGGRAEWLAQRRKSIGASEIGALFGVHRYHSPYSLWSVKTGRLEESAEISEEAKWGLRLEPAIADGYAEDYGVELHDPGRFEIARHPRFPFVSCTFDRLILDEDGAIPLEIKLPSDFKWQEWQEDDAPLFMHLQLMQQIAIADAPRGVLFALVGGQRPRRIEVQRDEELISIIINAATEFMHLVDNDIEPAIDEHPATTEALKHISASIDNKMIDLPRAALRWDEQIRRCDKALARINAIRERNCNRLRRAIGNAHMGVLPTGAIWGWKPNTKGNRALRRSR